MSAFWSEWVMLLTETPLKTKKWFIWNPFDHHHVISFCSVVDIVLLYMFGRSISVTHSTLSRCSNTRDHTWEPQRPPIQKRPMRIILPVGSLPSLSGIRWWTCTCSFVSLLCPVHALCIYLNCTESSRCRQQLVVCFRGQQKGKAASKKRTTHWILEANYLAYQAQGVPYPLGVWAYAATGFGFSWALGNGAL